MDRHFLKEILSDFSRGLLTREAAIELLEWKVPGLLRAGELDDLLDYCESVSRHLDLSAESAEEEILSHALKWLDRKKVSGQQRIRRPQKSPPLEVTIRLGHGVAGRISSHGTYSGVVLAVTDPTLQPRLDAWVASREFKELLKWFEARATTVAGRPYFLLRSKQVPKLLREFRLLLETTWLPGQG